MIGDPFCYKGRRGYIEVIPWKYCWVNWLKEPSCDHHDCTNEEHRIVFSSWWFLLMDPKDIKFIDEQYILMQEV